MPVFVKWSLENMCHVTKSGIFVTSSIFRQKKSRQKICRLNFFLLFCHELRYLVGNSCRVIRHNAFDKQCLCV